MRQVDFDIAQSKYDGLTPCDLQPRPTYDEIEAEKSRRLKLIGNVSDSVLGLYSVEDLNKEITVLEDADMRLLGQLRDKILQRLHHSQDMDDYQEFRDHNY